MGRVLTFADRAVVKMAQNDFVPVAADDWYQRRRKDAEGEFFRSVAQQGPRKGDGTKQGVYVFTAGGKLLGYRNHHDPEVMRGFLQQSLKDWGKLPADQRGPGAVKVPPRAKVDPAYARMPPPDALIVNVHTRILERTGTGDYVAGSCEFPGGDRAAHDRLWLTAEEWQGLLPKAPKPGDEVAVPRRLVLRLARFHLVDNTRGEPPMWGRDEVRTADLKLIVEGVTDAEVRARLEGAFLLGTDADPQRAERGYDARLLGYLTFDRAKGAIVRLDAVALGEHWGSSPLTRGARPGRTPLGVALSLAGGGPGDRVPPQASRYLRGYLHAEE